MTLHWKDDLLALHLGDAAQVELAPRSVQTIVCSPPFYGLRDYGVDEQLGMEETVEAYVARLVRIFHHLRPALASTGTLWVNIDDSWSGRANAGRAYDGYRGLNRPKVMPPRKSTTGDAPFKNMILVPERFALAMQADGWRVRSRIVWRKTNAKPESVQDRPSHVYETVWLFSKQVKYLYDRAAIAEKVTRSSISRSKRAYTTPEDGAKERDQPLVYEAPEDEMKNAPDVWDIAVSNYSGAHFATFPPELARRCILAGSRPGDTVLDPFHGSGTTGMVALEQSRRYIGIDVNAEYLDMSLNDPLRLGQPALPVEA